MQKRIPLTVLSLRGRRQDLHKTKAALPVKRNVCRHQFCNKNILFYDRKKNAWFVFKLALSRQECPLIEKIQLLSFVLKNDENAKKILTSLKRVGTTPTKKRFPETYTKVTFVLRSLP